jgi:hypothetical protein
LESGGGFGPYLEWLEQLTAAGVSQLIVEIPADGAAFLWLTIVMFIQLLTGRTEPSSEHS